MTSPVLDGQCGQVGFGHELACPPVFRQRSLKMGQNTGCRAHDMRAAEYRSPAFSARSDPMWAVAPGRCSCSRAVGEHAAEGLLHHVAILASRLMLRP